MKLLLDTHALLWFDWGHAKLSTKVRDLMADGNNDLLLSVASLWEIAIKIGIGKLTLAEPYEAFMDPCNCSIRSNSSAYNSQTRISADGFAISSS